MEEEVEPSEESTATISQGLLPSESTQSLDKEYVF